MDNVDLYKVNYFLCIGATTFHEKFIYITLYIDPSS